MNGAKRRLAIFETLKEVKSVEVKELAKQYGVSSMTIRRDLAQFSEQGLVTVSYGGAVLNEGSAIEPSFSLKSAQAQDAKDMIAKAAAKLVNDGESIVLDCGTSTFAMAKYLGDKSITVITNSWQVLQYLRSYPKVKVILAPGVYSRIAQGAISAETITFFHQYHVDKVFMSTQGFDVNWGCSVPDEMDANVKKALMESGQYRILLVDQTKFDQRYLAHYADNEAFDLVICDKIDDASQRTLKQKQVGIMIAQEKTK